jgi:nitrate/TMAO reductase-like tetraheme cytochrome c subunit
VLIVGMMAVLIGISAIVGYAYLMKAPEPQEAAPANAEPVATPGSVETESFPIATEKPAFDEWPKDSPAFVLVVSGEMLGYMRPCGCSEGQTGGMARRAGLIDYLTQEKKWEAAAIDFGDLVKAEVPWDAGRYHYSLESLKALGYRVVGIGPKDLSIKATTVAGEALNLEPLRMVAAGIKSADENFNLIMGEFIPPVQTFEVAGKKVSVGSYIGESQVELLRDRSIRIEPASEILPLMLEQMTAASADLKVLFAHVPKSEAVDLAKTYPGFDLVISQSETDHPLPQDAVREGKTLVAWVGKKGMDVTVAGFWPGQDPAIRLESVSIEGHYRENEQVNEIYAQFVDYLNTEEYLAKVPQVPHSSGAKYLGSSACAACHKRIFEHWKTTKHSHALQTLEDAKPTGQDYNPECIICHVVGNGFETGFVTSDRSPGLGGVGCENCHGPGSVHANAPNDPKGREMVRRVKNESDCIKCHDADNSVHFNFEKYWPKVAHPWGIE